MNTRQRLLCFFWLTLLKPGINQKTYIYRHHVTSALIATISKYETILHAFCNPETYPIWFSGNVKTWFYRNRSPYRTVLRRAIPSWLPPTCSLSCHRWKRESSVPHEHSLPLLASVTTWTSLFLHHHQMEYIYSWILVCACVLVLQTDKPHSLSRTSSIHKSLQYIRCKTRGTEADLEGAWLQYQTRLSTTRVSRPLWRTTRSPRTRFYKCCSYRYNSRQDIAGREEKKELITKLWYNLVRWLLKEYKKLFVIYKHFYFYIQICTLWSLATIIV